MEVVPLVPEAMAEEWPGAEERGEIARLDPSLQLVGLRLRDLALPQGRVDLVDGCRLRRVLELLRGDAEMSRDGVEERLPGRGGVPGSRNGSAAPADDGEGGDSDCECLPRAKSLHARMKALDSKTGLRSA